MRYHFVLNGYLQNCQKVLQEMEAFKHTYLSEIEEGVTYLYCREEKQRKVLPKSQSIMADGDTLKRLVDRFGAANVKVV